MLGTVGQMTTHRVWFRANFLRAGANGSQLLLHGLVQHLLAINATPPGASALHGNVFDGLRRAERLVEVIDVADLGRSGIATSNALGIRDGGRSEERRVGKEGK